jgi:Polyketide cyclase / dehydrase and lipid transport
MTTLHAEVIIDAPAAAVWEVVAHQFDRIGEWATAIVSSAPTPGPSPIARAPVAGRACRTGIALVPQVTERIVAYDEANHTLTYQAVDTPSFLGTARNQWRVTTLDESRTRVSLDATVQVHGILGRLMYLVLGLQIARTRPQFLHDLKHFVEHGRPSPRKQRQFRAPRR